MNKSINLSEATMNKFLSVLALIVVIGVAAVAGEAATPPSTEPPAPATPPAAAPEAAKSEATMTVTGSFTISSDKHSIIVTSGGAPITLLVGDTAAITSDGMKVTLSELNVSKPVTVSYSGEKALTIDQVKKKKKKKKDP